MNKLKGFKKRCETAQKCLPDAPYKNMLVNLHKEMLAEIERTQRQSIIINENAVIEVIGRLIGRGLAHKNSGDQTTDEKKKKAHYSAWYDMHSFAEDLANATDNPEYYKTQKAYDLAVGRKCV